MRPPSDVTNRLLGSVAPAAPGVSAERPRRLLDSPVYATVASDGSPHQSVVWIGRDGDDVLFVVAVGSRKEPNPRRDPRVSVLAGLVRRVPPGGCAERAQ